MKEFPSPHGDCISQIKKLSELTEKQIPCFRPLTGTAFLK